MIFITAKFHVLPEDADAWPDITREFTQATRAEPVDWQVTRYWGEDPTVYVLVEAFRDDEAGEAHVTSDHFTKARSTLPPHLVRTPEIVNVTVPQEGWSLLGEMAVPARD